MPAKKVASTSSRPSVPDPRLRARRRRQAIIATLTALVMLVGGYGMRQFGRPLPPAAEASTPVQIASAAPFVDPAPVPGAITPSSPAPVDPSPSRPQLIYVFDPLCGWCFGFSPVMQQLKARYQDRVDFDIVSGGMIVGNRIGPIGQVAPYIKTAYRDVEKATGVTFGQAFLKGVLEEGSAIFTSIPASVSLAVVKALKPEGAFEFGHLLQEAIYVDGALPAHAESFAPYAERVGVKREQFLAAIKDPEYQRRAERDFATSDSLQVRGFPAVFLIKGRQAYQLTSGYTPLPQISASLERALKKD